METFIIYHTMLWSRRQAYNTVCVVFDGSAKPIKINALNYMLEFGHTVYMGSTQHS